MKTAILIVDHGSKKKAANEMLKHIAEHVSRLRPEFIVETAHMELADPSIQQGIQKCVELGAKTVVVHPYMLSPGRHATEDIPKMVQVCARHYPEIKIRVTEPLGVDSRIAEVVLSRTGL